MKKILIVISIIANSVLFAQEVVSFTDSNNTWFEAVSYPNASWEYPNFVETVTNVYGFREGDTLIDGEVWKRLYRSRNENFSSGFYFECFVREQDNYVFYKKANENYDTLYNFNITPGEQVEYPGFLSTEVLTATAIDSIEIGGVVHKRIFFEDQLIMGSYEEIWIEGIGSIHGPTNPYNPSTFSDESPNDKDLTCFENDPVYYWTNPDYSQCYLSIILSADQPFHQSSFKVFPNPASDFIHLELNVPGQIEGSIKIIDQTGRMIGEMKSYIGNRITLDISKLKPGIYYLKYIGHDNVITTGFIKIPQ